ncbi:cobalamin biosynthesis protein CobG [Sphingobium sp. HBC34]|uniref:Cobalamin biosynthesis protein CobG n=1 Tax=Sphingobium cyanobacteriorum TaxID=3063954 RepID=A0ABT8ZQ39_9SPHN|nr:cobalamin biosynthesis protein CobG [Sphingobium sp. HBC34]MDO7836659.1 cobalamin biosynthesis protein CobG [Sphingobium sp. HBC34]
MSLIKGWCPDAWHPMTAGDGLLVRVRPPLGRIDGGQLAGLCDAAMAHGNGLIDLTSRANLQLRGVSAQGWQSLIARLFALGLVHADPVLESRRALLIAPDWQSGDDSARIAGELAERLAELPDLPAKTGFLIDAGMARRLAGEAGDFRIERSATGGLILRADGRSTGIAVTRDKAVDALIALAHWFVASGGAQAGRMARHAAPLPDWAQGDIAPASATAPVRPGRHPLGFVYGAPFGQVAAATLARLAPHALRLTPWRTLIVQGSAGDAIDGLLRDASDPLLRVDACPGQPRCPQATVETRALARSLAPHVSGRLHVSGCAKGCARAAPADLCLTGREGRYDLARNASAAAPPQQAGLDRSAILDLLGVPDAACL